MTLAASMGKYGAYREKFSLYKATSPWLYSVINRCQTARKESLEYITY